MPSKTFYVRIILEDACFKPNLEKLAFFMDDVTFTAWDLQECPGDPCPAIRIDGILKAFIGFPTNQKDRDTLLKEHLVPILNVDPSLIVESKILLKDTRPKPRS